MWNIFKKNKKEIMFQFEYKWGILNLNTIICAKDKPSAIKKFTNGEIFTQIISIKELT